MKLKTIDLCAGIGGIRRGFELAGGYRNIASAEIDEMACKTYEHLFHEDPRNDVTNEKFKKHLQTLHYDVLMAGFPCQAFSSVGLQHGFEDKTKGTIFFDIAKIIKMTRPKVVFLENVQNLLSHDKQATFKTIVDTLDRQLDYHIVGVTHDKDGIPQYKRSAFLRNSRDFGVPQNRPRVFGNSVTIPVIEEYALFIQQCCDTMYDAFSPIEKRLFSMYGNEFLLCSLISRELAYHLRKDTLNRYFSIVYHYKLNCFRTKELARYLDVSAARASQIITQLTQIGCVHQESDGSYQFEDLLSFSK